MLVKKANVNLVVKDRTAELHVRRNLSLSEADIRQVVTVAVALSNVGNDAFRAHF